MGGGSSTAPSAKDVRSSKSVGGNGDQTPVSTASSRHSSRNSVSESLISAFKGKPKEMNEEEICRYLYPVYYIEPDENPLTADENDLAKASWEIILKDNAPAYLARKAAMVESQKEEENKSGFLSSVPLQSCKEWFTALFYERLFDVHPYAKALFSDPEAQGKFLIALFSFIFTAFDNPKAYQAKLKYLGEVHALRGVKASEYGIVGECMFKVLRTVFGDQAYNNDLHVAWVKIFSGMMKIMVPIAVHHELSDNSAQVARFEKHGLESLDIFSKTSFEKMRSQSYRRLTDNNGKTEGVKSCPFHMSSVQDSLNNEPVYDKIPVTKAGGGCEFAV